MKDVENEISLMQKMDHPHIVKYFDEFKMDKMNYIQCIVMEICEVNESFIESQAIKSFRKINFFTSN